MRGGVIAALVAGGLLLGCETLPPPPVQPIAFSHRVHAGVNRIGCTMCHAYAEQSPVAGIPSMARCAGCHKFVARDKPEVQRVNQAYAEGRVVEWIRVHRVPDHVRFTHQRHVAAGLRCQQCHGQVETMDVVKQVSPLNMGWCVDCHRERKATLECLGCHK